MKYKIRMATGTVDDTGLLQDSTWTPFARIAIDQEIKPYISGQLFLMDIMEKAAIAVHRQQAVSSILLLMVAD